MKGPEPPVIGPAVRPSPPAVVEKEGKGKGRAEEGGLELLSVIIYDFVKKLMPRGATLAPTPGGILNET